MASPLINLCDPVFRTVVTCDTVSSEGYEVTNLLSEDCEKKRNGFMCDRFIKPPVEIVFKFPFDVHIRYIQIGAQVGQQKSSGFDISSTSVPYNSSLCSGSTSFKHQPMSGLGFSPTAERIASALLNDVEKGMVIFCPLHYGRQSLNPVPNIRTDFVQKPMMWKKRSVIAHVSSLTVRIFRTNGSSVPALGSIEVWGGPSSCMPANKVADIMKLWEAGMKKEIPDVQDISKEEAPHAFCKKLDEFILPDIPEEYLDAITWEIMSLPMVLPSGKVVDQQTLDLHAQAEANWGRHPSDPFTGIMFGDGCRPILDSALKARIDRFLVLNQDRKDLKTVPRTVGRAQPQICHQTVTRFRNNRVCFDSGSSNRKRSASGSMPSSSVYTPGERPLYDLIAHSSQSQRSSSASCSGFQNPADVASSATINSNNSKEPKRPNLSQDTSIATIADGLTQDDDDDVCIIVNEDKKMVDDLKSHEKKLDDSLDSALKAALSGLPSFVNPPTPKAILKDCGSCKTSECLYSLPCSHFLCRTCLVKESKLKPSKCVLCSVEFKSSDPVFYHK